jgi:hypothetical protein
MLGTPNTPIDPVTVIGGDGYLDLSVSGVQDGSIFDTQGEEVNSSPGDRPGSFGSIPVHALNWKDGSLNPQMLGYTLFRVSVPPIVNNCVANLRIRIAVANWCEKKQNEATDGNNNRADWWFTARDGDSEVHRPGSDPTGVLDDADGDESQRHRRQLPRGPTLRRRGHAEWIGHRSLPPICWIHLAATAVLMSW